MKMQNLGKADQLVWQASCTARLTLWKKKYLSLTFIGIRGSKKSHFFVSKRELFPISSSLTCANYWQHPASTNDLCTWYI